MKKKAIIYSILAFILFIVIFNIFSSGNKHLVVVDENVHLSSENNNLKKENTNLKTLNSSLKKENLQLSEKNKFLESEKNILIKQNKTETQKNDKINKIVIKIEQDIYSNLGWIDGENAIQVLEEKLKRKPNKAEAEETLYDLLERELLYFPDYPDPYLRGKKYNKKEIKKLLDKLY